MTNWAMFESLKYLDIAISQVVTNTYPLIVCVLALLILKEKVKPSSFFFLLTSIGGVALLVDLSGSHGSTTNFGMFLVISAACTYAFEFIVQQKINSGRDIHFTVVPIYTQLASFIYIPVVACILPGILNVQYY